MVKKIIVTTTINAVTPAIERFQDMLDWDLVVIGDHKTPTDYKLRRGIYVSPKMQADYDLELSDAIGWNCIQRRNFGLLWAKDLGADIVAVVDDDNIPYADWGQNLLLGRPVDAFYHTTPLPVFDPVYSTNHPHLWHRGFPLQLLTRRREAVRGRRLVTPQIQADFWDGDPDIDAFCRMEHAPECTFSPHLFPLAANKPGPFNSQNTFLDAKILKDYFLYPGIGRMDDIWASYYVQAKGAQLIYARPSVYQARNVHDLTRDLKNEYLGYEQNTNLLTSLAADPESIWSYLPEQAQRAWRLYQRHF